MGLKSLVVFAALVAVALAPTAVAADSIDQTGANRPATSISPLHSLSPSPLTAPHSAPSSALGAASSSRAAARSAQSASNTTQETGSEGGNSDCPPPRITIANPAPAPSSWSLHERILWAANLVLVLVAYAGILLALSLLKKIERQTGYAETAATAAATSAQAALLNAQAVIHAERPWILISVEPSRSKENSFTVTATNRGRTPARIVATAERTRIAIDEARLPGTPEYGNEEPKPPRLPIILLPGESTDIKPFGRDDVKGLCDSEERFKRIEAWEEKVFLYGKLVYQDLVSPADSQLHETNWCCWYIHGRQNSGLILAGPAEYNLHT
jgi:hypothetical protein